MHIQPLHQPGRMIRFRHWSGKSYAMFCSLHRHVTIGSVTMGIADMALSKTEGSVSSGKTGKDCHLSGDRNICRLWEEDSGCLPEWELLFFMMAGVYMPAVGCFCVRCHVQGGGIFRRFSIVSLLLTFVAGYSRIADKCLAFYKDAGTCPLFSVRYRFLYDCL